MRKNKHNFTWPRALIELLIVAAGVLLALASDQWLESRKDRAEEALLLRSVRTEIKTILKDMDTEMVFRQAMLENANQVYALAERRRRRIPKSWMKCWGNYCGGPTWTSRLVP